MSIETNGDYQLPSTPKDQQAIRNAADEIVIQLMRKAAADDQIKAIVERMKEELEVPPKFLKKMATVRFKDESKGNEFDKLVQEHGSFEVAYETLYRKASDQEDSEE
ncbi:hypothetical protein Xoosp13_314 [Xanthomonas phage Xoo-sp13]|nr:hypothetical protein Xoosp13_314 [Xanthomonas phage Xoo-sp13]